MTLAFERLYFYTIDIKLPSVTGSGSHLTGTTFGALTFGPKAIPLLGAVVLLFQALLLARGGLTTLGANVVSMAVVGPWVGYGIFCCASGSISPILWLSSSAAFLGSFSTYIMTSIQLAVAFPDGVGGI